MKFTGTFLIHQWVDQFIAYRVHNEYHWAISTLSRYTDILMLFTDLFTDNRHWPVDTILTITLTTNIYHYTDHLLLIHWSLGTDHWSLHRQLVTTLTIALTTKLTLSFVIPNLIQHVYLIKILFTNLFH